MKRDLLRLRAALLASGSLAITGCMSLAAIEPVRAPPAGYQADVTVQVEFLHPARVGARCAERGVSLFGMPMPNAMACANTKLMTLPNPCDTVTGGWYAEALCREIGHSRGWEAEAPAEAPQLMAASWVPDEAVRRPQGPEGDLRRGVAIRVEFVDAGEIGLRCAERGAVAFGRPTLNALSCSSQVMMSLPNPCSLPDAGWYANLLCHEMGHVNGWPANHPGRSFLQDGEVPASHPVPDPEDGGGYVMSFIAALQKARANSEDGAPVRATVLASLASGPERAEDIALKAGIRQLPDIAMPRLDQLPPRLVTSLTLPSAPAGVLGGPDFSRPMGPLGLRRSGTRLTRAGLEALFASAGETSRHDDPFTARPLGSQSFNRPGRALLPEVHLAEAHALGAPGEGLSLRASLRLGPAAQAEPDAPQAPVPAAPSDAVWQVAGSWPAGFGTHPALGDRILPLLAPDY